MLMALDVLKISCIFYSIIGLKHVFLVFLVPAPVRAPSFVTCLFTLLQANQSQASGCCGAFHHILPLVFFFCLFHPIPDRGSTVLSVLLGSVFEAVTGKVTIRKERTFSICFGRHNTSHCWAAARQSSCLPGSDGDFAALYCGISPESLVLCHAAEALKTQH